MTPTEIHFHNFATRHQRFSPSKWIHDHPTANKALQIAIAILGVSALAAICIHPSRLFTLGFVGTTLLTTPLINYLFLRFVTCNRHEMTHHVYTPAEYFKNGVQIGRLYYRGHIPVLELQSENDFENGEAHGFILAPQIHELSQRFNFAVQTLLRNYRPEQIPRLLAEVWAATPEKYRNEINGIVFGYNKWAAENGKTHRLSRADLLLIHLIPEMHHLNFSSTERSYRRREQLPVTGCTTIVDRGELLRNMDWCLYGKAEYSVVTVWKQRRIANLGVPTMIGVVTGFSPNVRMAMNVCPGETTTVRGIPSVLYNRQVLEQISRIDQTDQVPGQPLGPCHLALSDTTGAGKVISFYQREDGGHYTRHLGTEPLITLNWTYPRNKGNVFNSKKRDKLLKQLYHRTTHLNRSQLNEKALTLYPYINSKITVHNAIFRGERVSFGIDNGFAASQPREIHLINSFFEQ